MAGDDRTRLIPIEDRRRELIAARQTARVRRLYGTSETQQAEPAVLPVWLTSEDVVGLIAYGKTKALSGPVPGAPPMFERWRSHVSGLFSDDRQYPLVRQLRLVLARVRWWQSRKRRRAGAATCPTPPLDRITRGHIRWIMRHHDMPAIQAMALLRADVRRLIAAQHAHEVNIESAVAILCAGIAAERIIAWGRRGVWRTRRYTSGIHEKIPPEFFANPQSTILPDGWATCGWDESVQHWADWNGPDWGDVRFKRDDVLRLLKGTQPLALLTSTEEKQLSPRPSVCSPAVRSNDTSPKNEGTPSLPERRGPPPASDMMTACEALTWIAFGKPLTKEQLASDKMVQFDKWQTTKLDDLLRALESRTSKEPYTPLEGTFSHQGVMGDYVGRSCAPSFRALRARARKQEGRLISFRELRDELALECARLENSDRLLKQASSMLRGALASERIIAFGQQHQGLQHEAVPATFFMDPAIEITWWNTAESELGFRRYVNVQFRTGQILALWPSTPLVESSSVESTIFQQGVSDKGADIQGQPAWRTAKLRPLSQAALRDWYIDRRDSWPSGRKHPSAAEDLIDAREHFKDYGVSRDMIRAARAKWAPEEWTTHGRRKRAQK